MKGTYQTISLDRIHDPEYPLRGDLSRESVKDLALSIKQVGIINPLTVKKKDKNYELITGHRRLVAAGVAGLTEAPCILIKVKGIKGEVIKIQENLARESINPIEWAKHLSYLKKQYKLDNTKISEMLGMSESWVGQHLQISDYPASLLEALDKEQVSFSSARELAQIKDPKKRDIYVKHAVRGGLTPALAIRWKNEANRQPLKQSGGSGEGEETTTPSYEPEKKTCPVCDKEVRIEDMIMLTIHKQCQPTTYTKPKG